MPLLTSIEANISHEENRKVFFLIKFPLKLIYSTEKACPGKVPVQHLDIVLTDATVFEQEKYLLINKHCQRHNRPKALVVHNCTIFLCSLDVRNIVQGGDPLYAAVNHKQGCGGYT